MYLVSKGLTFGTNGNGLLHRTFSNKHKYYLTEEREAMRLLTEYRNSNVRST